MNEQITAAFGSQSHASLLGRKIITYSQFHLDDKKEHPPSSLTIAGIFRKLDARKKNPNCKGSGSFSLFVINGGDNGRTAYSP